jgi:membrane protease YdiL (CAAX protease family)
LFFFMAHLVPVGAGPVEHATCHGNKLEARTVAPHEGNISVVELSQPPMPDRTRPPKALSRLREERADGVYAYFALACLITWVLAIPAARAWMRHETPQAFAVACAGLSAFGPTLAVVAVAGPRRQLRSVFGRWRTSPLWVFVALLAPLAVHLLATLLYVAIGGRPEQWLHPPVQPEHLAALVVFPIGEEFGWRGFAYPRMADRYGPVKGSLLVGCFWGLWHLAYAITPEAAGFDFVEFGTTMVELPLYSLLIAWVFERANRSMAVALAFHAGDHLDHIERASRADPRLHVLHLAVVAVIAVAAARSLARRSIRCEPA